MPETITATNAGNTVSGGIVSTSSTTVAVRLTANLANVTGALQCQAITCQQVVGNTGAVYICNTANPSLTTTMIGVLWVVPPPSTSPTVLPMMTIGDPAAPAALNGAEFFLVGANADEGLRITFLKPGT